VVPIINENDTVAVEELRFGDNDTLAALIAGAIGAQLLLILTDKEGLYDEEGRVVREVKQIDERILRFAKECKGAFSFGGMKTKIEAASIAMNAGAVVIIADGTSIDNVKRAVERGDVGTKFLPQRRLSSRKHWIFYNLRSCGRIIVDEGAKKAIKEKGKSLLPSGIKRVEKDFREGDAVIVVDERGEEFAKGLTNYSAKDLLKIMGKHTRQIKDALGACFYEEVIHRDNLVLI
jgi:glutamate 5-kinase